MGDRADLSPYGLSVAVDWSESGALRGPRRYVPLSQGVSTVALRGMSESEAGGRYKKDSVGPPSSSCYRSLLSRGARFRIDSAVIGRRWWGASV